MKYTLYITLSFLLIGCTPKQELKLIKADLVPQVLVTSPTWIEIHQDNEVYLGLTKEQFKHLMSDLNKIADRMEKLDLSINYYEKLINEANR